MSQRFFVNPDGDTVEVVRDAVSILDPFTGLKKLAEKSPEGAIAATALTGIYLKDKGIEHYFVLTLVIGLIGYYTHHHSRM